jgi:hypothetical protein
MGNGGSIILLSCSRRLFFIPLGSIIDFIAFCCKQELPLKREAIQLGLSTYEKIINFAD